MEIQKLKNAEWTPRFLAYCTPVLMMTMIVNQMMVLKSINLFGLSIVASVITYPLSLIACDVITEVYGYKRTRRLIWLCLSLYALAMLFVQLAIALPPADDYINEDMFRALFGQLPLLAVGGILGYLAGELANSYIMSAFKNMTGGKYFYFRALGSTVISQFLCNLAFFSIGFWGTMGVKAVLTTTCIYVGLNVAYEILVLPLTHRIAQYLKKLEGVDYYD